MGTVSDKLTYLNTTKGKIKDSINLTGANLTNETFRQYATTLKDTLAHILKNPSPIWDNFPKTTGTGSAIQVNTYNSWLDYSLDGNTTQDGTPTPTSPIPISNVSGLQEVEITNGTTTNTYEVNLGDIELNKINTYKDYIFKGKGINLFDKDNISTLNAKYGETITADSNERTCYISCKPNTTYTLYHKPSTPMRNSIFTTNELPQVGTTTYGGIYSSNTPLTFTTNANAKYLCWQFYATNDSTTTLQQMLDSMLIVEGSYTSSTMPPYEPYNAKDKWLLHKEIGKVVLNGTPSWRRSGTKTSGNYYFFEDSLLSDVKFDSNNRFIGVANMGITTNTYQEIQGFDTIYHNNTYVRSRFYSDTTKAMSTSEFATWLSSHNIITYYVLNTPTTTEITNSELLEDLDSIELLDGLNNITINGDLSAIMNLTCLEKE